MLSRLHFTTTLNIPPLTYILRNASSISNKPPKDNESPFPHRRDPRPLRKPIKTGRNSKNTAYSVKDVVESPFKGKSLPFGRKVIFENRLEEDLAKGRYWSKYIDRFGEYIDFDIAHKAWGNENLYMVPHLKQPMKDITTSHDIDFHFTINNLAMHVHMARYIPQFCPLIITPCALNIKTFPTHLHSHPHT